MRKVTVLIAIILCVVLQASAQWARANNLSIIHNVNDNGRPMLKVCFTLEAHGLQGHTLIPVLFVDRDKGVGHVYKNGQPMKHDGTQYYVPYQDTYWNGDGQFIGIYNDSLNPLPGKHTYNVRILVWDSTTSSYVGSTDINDTEWCSYDMTGASQGYSPVPAGRMIDNSSYPIPYTPPVNANCGVCGGTGRCSICGGSGTSPNHASGIRASCGGCGGTGKCATCRGLGVL